MGSGSQAGIQTSRMLQQLLLLTFLALAQAESECPFVSGVACPVEVMNALDVFYYDINDETSCQHQCNTIGACNFFTQLPAGDNSHMKCFLFSTCDNEEACDSCLSGPEEPPMGECLRTASNPGWNKTKRSSADSYTWTTTAVNISALLCQPAISGLQSKFRTLRILITSASCMDSATSMKPVQTVSTELPNSANRCFFSTPGQF